MEPAAKRARCTPDPTLMPWRLPLLAGGALTSPNIVTNARAVRFQTINRLSSSSDADGKFKKMCIRKFVGHRGKVLVFQTGSCVIVGGCSLTEILSLLQVLKLYLGRMSGSGRIVFHKVEIQNIVSVGMLERPIDLHQLAKEQPLSVAYTPKKFPGARCAFTFGPDNKVGAINVFTSGKFVIPGQSRPDDLGKLLAVFEKAVGCKAIRPK